MKASDYFAQQLDHLLTQSSVGSQLPKDRELAKEFKVSVATVRRVLTQFQQRGKVTRLWGKGTIVGSVVPRPIQASISPAKSSGQSLVDAIVSSIVQGDLKEGDPLPSVKFMCMKFKVASSTVAYAYRQLQAKGYVTRMGRTFWVGKFQRLAKPPLQKEVFLFNHRSTDFTGVFTTDMFSSAYQRLESELRNHGFVVRFESTQNLSRLLTIWSKKAHVPYGLVFFNVHDFCFSQIVPPLERHAQKLKVWKTAVLFDWQGNDYRLLKKFGNIISRGNVISSFARSLGQFLIRGKFQEARLFFEGTTPAWAHDVGVLQVAFRLRRELKHLDPNLSIKLILQKRDSQLTLPKFIAEHVIPFLKGFQLEKYQTDSISSLEQEIQLVEDLALEFMESKNRSVWVFSKDGDAVRALQWAQSRGLQIPKALSIVGLENDPHFFHYGLSCCGPDWQSIGYLMAHSIIRDIPVEKTRLGFIRTKAQVIERLTTQ